MKKIVLAFSGGLDTLFCVPYLMEKGYQVVTVTVDTGGFSKPELQKIAKKSKQLGAAKHYQIDAKKKMFDQVVSYIIKTNGLYEGSYPNMCADRYVIAEEILKVSKNEKTYYVGHGSTAMGNDQVRFDVALMTLESKIKIITPIREMGGNREQEKAYLKKKGFCVSDIHNKYSVNQNILGVTYSGGEIDEVREPDESMFLWTKQKKNKSMYVEIGFIKGIPVSFNGKKQEGFKILQKLNKLVGSYGFGREFYTGNCIIGIKGHIVFEAPGALALIKAHLALEQLVLTKNQFEVTQIINQQFTNLLFVGKFYDPVVKNLKDMIDSVQENVTGKVILKLSSGQAQTVEVSSPNSLIQSNVAVYAQGCSWTAKEAEGFIKLYGLQGKISAGINKLSKKGGYYD